jgi:hypothetical protein
MAVTVTFSNAEPNSSASDILFIGVPSPVGLIEPGLPRVMASWNFVQEELFVSGTVAGQPYKTSLLVRRPADRSTFSGLIAIEPVHIQGALGFWQTCHTAIMRDGHAWAAIGSQRGAVEGPIKTSNPKRYAPLHVPPGLGNESSRSAEAMNAWSMGESPDLSTDVFANDAISNAILVQVGAALKAGTPGSPFQGTPVSSLILGGASQTGVATLNFIANAHTSARMPDGEPVFDGFLPMAAPGWSPIADCDVPVVQIFAEGDLILFGSIGPMGYKAKRADSDAPVNRYRCYQITGAAHLPTRGLADVRALPHLGISLDPTERFSQFPAEPFYRGAFVNLVRWMLEGIAPPRASPIVIADGRIVTDKHGNATGGLRSPWVDSPCARHDTCCYLRNLIGVELLFAPHQLYDQYASIPGYLERFDTGIDQLVQDGWLLSEDGDTLKADEAAQLAF